MCCQGTDYNWRFAWGHAGAHLSCFNAQYGKRAIAICGELSWLCLMVPAALPLIPLARFPGFVWIIATGLAMPSSIERSVPTGEGSAGKGRSSRQFRTAAEVQ